MKLYFSPGTCSLAPHITLREAAVPFELVRTDIKTHTLSDGSDYYRINSKGAVPLLELDNGERLSEGPAIMQYIADLDPTKNLAPPNGTFPRYRLQEWLNYISSELHKSFGPLFASNTNGETKVATTARLTERLTWVNNQLAGKRHLLGDMFTVADAYLFTIAGWGKYVGIDISSMTKLNAFMDRVAARPAVNEALQAEGLLK